MDFWRSHCNFTALKEDFSNGLYLNLYNADDPPLNAPVSCLSRNRRMAERSIN